MIWGKFHNHLFFDSYTKNLTTSYENYNNLLQDSVRVTDKLWKASSPAFGIDSGLTHDS